MNVIQFISPLNDRTYLLSTSTYGSNLKETIFQYCYKCKYFNNLMEHFYSLFWENGCHKQMP
jgi:hypothetical protein